MVRRSLLWVLWLGFVAYSFFLAPPNQPETLTQLQKLSTLQWQDLNPIIVALFNLLGIWPVIYACLMLIDGRMQKIPAWPFFVGSFGTGAFLVLPYLALRTPNSNFSGPKTILLKILDSRWTGIALTLSSLGFLAYGLMGGDWQNFAAQWQTSRFVNVMSLDFCALCLLFPALLGDDMARRGLNHRGIFWAVALIPLLGPLVYLSLRPPLEAAETREPTQSRLQMPSS